MEIAERKQKILLAVVEGYIATGEPVGSKTLQNYLDLNVSSATIRNEMADLTARGFLLQPHTSAGRVPSQMGYRFYVDNLMKRVEPTISEKAYIEKELTAHSDAPENILISASKILAALTNMAAVTTTPPGVDARIHKLRFVQTGRHTAMVVLITSTGMVKSKLFRCEFVINADVLRLFDTAFNEKLDGVPLSEITRPFIQTLAASFGEMSLFMPDVLMAIMDLTNQTIRTGVNLSGQTKLLFLPEFDFVSARNVLSFLNNPADVAKLLLSKTTDTKIYLGNESGHSQLLNSGVIITRYHISNQLAGAAALVGPIRMNYPRLMGQLEYTALTVGNLISELLEA